MRNLTKFLIVGLVLTIGLSSCGRKGNGQLVGVMDRPSWKGINPYGMVNVPSGRLHIGAGDEDITGTMMARNKAISISGFYMDETEITNNEYRQFVSWVQDSIAHSMMDHFIEDEQGNTYVDWDQDLDYEDESLEDMFYQGDDRFAGQREMDVSQLVFEYQWKDWKGMAHARPDQSRTDFLHKEEINIYPDTLVWIRDFAYSYNEPMTRNYFWHPAFDDYPVVGISWKTARAFSYWRTLLWNSYGGNGALNSEDFRLPFEHEWEYASRGGHDLVRFPWGDYYLRNSKGCLLANFKPGRGNYPEDGGLYTVKADAYYPNDFGLYNMAGNVAEWTESAFYENAYSFIHDLNPDVRFSADEDAPEVQKRKVVRGGSWKDVGYFLETGTRSWEFQDTTKSYIGFRCALSFLGRSAKDF